MKKVQSSQFSVFSSKKQSFSSCNCLLLTVCWLLFLVSVVSAGAGGGGEAHPSIFKAYLWQIINFLVLVALLVFLVKKVDIKGYFRKRTELIEKSLNEAREAKELAEKALAEVEERLKVKDKEIEEILAAARQSGEKEKEKLIEESDKLRENILQQARTNIEFELKNAKESIKAEAVEIAMELAEKKLKDRLTKEEQLRLLEESISKIEGKK